MSDLQKVELASLYMVGKAETWYNDYVFGRQKVLWEFIKMRQVFDFTNLTLSYLISCEEAKCSAAGCEYALLSFGDGDSTNNATCRCLYSFCWKCTKEAHSPVDYSTVDKCM